MSNRSRLVTGGHCLSFRQHQTPTCDQDGAATSKIFDAWAFQRLQWFLTRLGDSKATRSVPGPPGGFPCIPGIERQLLGLAFYELVNLTSCQQSQRALARIPGGGHRGHLRFVLSPCLGGDCCENGAFAQPTTWPNEGSDGVMATDSLKTRRKRRRIRNKRLRHMKKTRKGWKGT